MAGMVLKDKLIGDELIIYTNADPSGNRSRFSSDNLFPID
jgi:hypothetical protein